MARPLPPAEVGALMTKARSAGADRALTST
jgi:hypothetical protein